MFVREALYWNDSDFWRKVNNAWKVSAFGVIIIRIFPHSEWIRRDTKYLSVSSPNVGELWKLHSLTGDLINNSKILRKTCWNFHNRPYFFLTCLQDKRHRLNKQNNDGNNLYNVFLETGIPIKLTKIWWVYVKKSTFSIVETWKPTTFLQTNLS